MADRSQSVRNVDADVQYHPNSDVYRVSFEPDKSATTGVVSALAQVNHCECTDIPPLYDSVDTDALDSLVSATTDSSVKVEFVVDGFEVSVYGDNTIEIVPPV